MPESLYGTKKPAKTKGKEIPSSTSLAFSSNLASLISSSTSKRPSGSSATKASKDKPNLFTAHHKSAKKRAAKELEDENGQKHQTKDDLGAVSTSDLHRSKKRMEEKVRLYNAMKRGEYVPRGNGYDDRGLVDFDRKWAEKQYEKEDSDASEDLSDDTEDEADNEIVEFTDEFGRLRKGTKKEAKQEERRTKIQAIAKEEALEFAARPQAPTNVIYGDAVQHQAFNPDRTIAEQMAELAKKRDKEATPPPETHFDANAEVRTKGTGFYTFSHDAEERKKEMEDLEKTRLETEKIRAEKQAKQGEEAKREDEKKENNPAEANTAGNADAQRFLDEFELT